MLGSGEDHLPQPPEAKKTKTKTKNKKEKEEIKKRKGLYFTEAQPIVMSTTELFYFSGAIEGGRVDGDGTFFHHEPDEAAYTSEDAHPA